MDDWCSKSILIKRYKTRPNDQWIAMDRCLFDDNLLVQLIRLVDKDAFGGRVISKVAALNISMGISWSSSLPFKTGARTLFYHHAISVIVNKRLFVNILNHCKSIGFSYHVGGVLCKFPSEAVYHLIAHELIHVAIKISSVLRGVDTMKANIGHGEEFTKALFKHFGHCSSLHGLIPGMIKCRSLCEIYKELGPDKPIWVFNLKRSVYEEGVIVSVSGRYVQVLLEHGQHKRVCLGLVEVNDPFLHHRSNA